MKNVDIIASGYEWVCPSCGRFNTEIEVKEIVQCPGCEEKFEINPPEHAYN
jgi:DNA-directed RNA polymerase subunit RPC12/RpoP